MCEYCEGESRIICVGLFSAVIRENRLVIDYLSGRSPQRVVRVIGFCPMCGRDLRGGER